MHDPYRPPESNITGSSPDSWTAIGPVRFRILFQDFQAMVRLRALPRRAFLVPGALLLVAMLWVWVMEVGEMIRGEAEASDYFFVAMIAGLAAWFLVLAPRRVNRTFWRNLRLHRPLEATFDGKGFSILQSGYHARMPWSLVERWSESGKVLLLHRTDGSIWIFPKRDFGSARTDALRELLSVAVGPVGKVRKWPCDKHDAEVEYTCPESMRLPTQRLVLRDIRKEDVPTIVAQYAEPSAHGEILAVQRDPAHIEEHFNAVAEVATGFAGEFRYQVQLAITLQGSDNVIGTCALTDVYPGSTEATIGWHLGEAHAGSGYATEAARALIRYAFDERGVARVNADCFASNTRSRRIFEKLGMRHAGPFNVRNLLVRRKYREARPIVRYFLDAPKGKAVNNVGEG